MNNKEKKILKDLETRLKTLMIGSISRFEDSFGYLWNHGDEPTNEQQESFRDKWEKLRTDLLNHGNHQIRQALDLVDDYIYYQNKFNYNYKFYISDDKNNRR